MNLDEIFGIIKEEDKLEDEIIDEIFKKDEAQIEEVLEREPSIEDCMEDIDDVLDNIWVLISLIRRSEESDEVLNDLADTTENLINSTEELLKKARGI
ncbi:MAG: hypothetical protein J6Y78_10810 [Paludibacteraceae bacterium]|nr:hypothetical protein [Paludibacteraceae bacterium]